MGPWIWALICMEVFVENMGIKGVVGSTLYFNVLLQGELI